jgi:acyl dehydratase
VTELVSGRTLGPEAFRITRADLVRYAGASGDFNPIHWSDRVARSVGLPGVVAHGMLTMALAGRAVSTWVGDPTRVVDFSVRFTRPVVVPDDDEGTQVDVAGVVVDTGDGGTRIDLTVSCDGRRVLGASRVTIGPPTAVPDA